MPTERSRLSARGSAYCPNPTTSPRWTARCGWRATKASWRRRSASDRADLDLRRYGHGIRAAFHPGDGILDARQFPEPVARDKFSIERSIDHAARRAVEAYPLGLARRTQTVAVL